MSSALTNLLRLNDDPSVRGGRPSGAQAVGLQATPGFAFTVTNEHEVNLLPTSTRSSTAAVLTPQTPLQTRSTSPRADIYETGRLQQRFPQGLKVYINVTSSGRMPPPSTDSETEIQKAIHADVSTVYQVPVYLGPPVDIQDPNNESRPAVVLDTIIHPRPLDRAMKDPDFRLYIIELCIEWVEERTQMQLSRRPLQTHTIDLPAPRPIEELGVGTSRPKSPASPTAVRVTPRTRYRRDNLCVLVVDLSQYKPDPKHIAVEVGPEQVVVKPGTARDLTFRHGLAGFKQYRVIYVKETRHLHCILTK
ncbi:hypothetical protein IWQ60_000544 [Tieghemiomyces parasiticus]|uniref:PIH1 N-terminal domain-containing protein n=1 Tax=Tieghemiomyces parasiticus TaxID=78921 RepID=A0A9W8ALG1_9FUNG|nr:hypothetical protein IWQ60_000544 [Tieghemiomyces parasiticus]